MVDQDLADACQRDELKGSRGPYSRVSFGSSWTTHIHTYTERERDMFNKDIKGC